MADQTRHTASSPATPPLVGRAREQAALRAALAAALAGRGGLVLIGGESGIGKTALAEVLCAEAIARGALVLVGHAYDLSETPPYGPWAEALARAPGDGELPTLPLAILPARPGGEELASQEAIIARAAAYLGALASHRPLVLLLEDMHWADRVSLDLLRVVGRGLAALPLLLLLNYRADEIARDHPLSILIPLLVHESRAARLDLRPLDVAALTALVAARYALATPDRDRLVRYLAARTEGNALFVGELLRTLEAEGVLRQAGDGWTLGSLAAVPVPALLRHVIDARLQRLPPETVRLLTIAAVIGQEVPLALWSALGEVAEGDLLDHAERALAARLLAEARDSDRLRFAHALIREALYAGTPVSRRRTLHRHVVDALLATGGVPDPDAVASHLGRAGDPREFAWLVRAGEWALSRHAPQIALDRLTRALDLARRQGIAPGADLYRARGMARETLGDFAGALTDHEAALAGARATGDGHAEWRAQLDLGQLWTARDYARAGEHYARALTLARGLAAPVALADSLNRLGNWLVNTGRPWEGVGHHREALALLEAQEDRRSLADTLDLLGMAEWIGTGEAAAAVRDFGRAIDLLRALDLPQQLSSCLASRNGAAGAGTFETVGTALWPPDACARDAEEALRLAGAADWSAGQVYAMQVAGQALASFGEFGRALDYLDRAFDLATAIDHRQWLAGTRCHLGQIQVLLLAPDLARAHLDAALALARDLGSPWWGTFAATYLALAQLQLGDHASAEAVLDAASAPDLLVGVRERTLQERRLTWAWAEVRLAQGRPAEALTIADRLLTTAPGAGPIPALLTVRGEALLALGRTDDAERTLDDAARGALLRHEHPRLWRAHAARATLYRAQGRLAEAGRAAEAASTAIESLAATLPEGALRDGFRQRASLAARLDDTRPPAATHVARPDGLSPRETEVLGLLAAGRSNHQIALSLSLSPRTVQRHVANVYLKIGAHNRAEATAHALRYGLR